jgi:hypothetical protein
MLIGAARLAEAFMKGLTEFAYLLPAANSYHEAVCPHEYQAAVRDMTRGADVVVQRTLTAALHAAPPIVALVQGGLRTMTTANMKIATALLLAAYLVGGANLALGGWPQEQAKSASSPPKVEGEKPKTDLYGDPLPEGALARLGTVRWRHGD